MARIKDIAGIQARASAPAGRAAAVDIAESASDSAGEFPFEGATLYVGTGGDLNIVPVGQDDAVLLKGVPSGTFVPIMVKEVVADSTTADDIVALF